MLIAFSCTKHRPRRAAAAAAAYPPRLPLLRFSIPYLPSVLSGRLPLTRSLASPPHGSSFESFGCSQVTADRRFLQIAEYVAGDRYFRSPLPSPHIADVFILAASSHGLVQAAATVVVSHLQSHAASFSGSCHGTIGCLAAPVIIIVSSSRCSSVVGFRLSSLSRFAYRLFIKCVNRVLFVFALRFSASLLAPGYVLFLSAIAAGCSRCRSVAPRSRSRQGCFAVAALTPSRWCKCDLLAALGQPRLFCVALHRLVLSTSYSGTCR